MGHLETNKRTRLVAARRPRPHGRGSIAVWAAVASCLLLCVVSRSPATPQGTRNQGPPISIRFRMPTPPNTADAAYYSAAVHYWPELGLQVTVEPGTSGAATVQSVAAGADEMAFSDFSASVVAIRQGAPITIVAAPSARDSNGVVFTKASGVHDWKDLVGKQVGFVQGAASLLEARIALQRKGIDPETVHWQSIPSGSQAALIKAGTLSIATAYARGTNVILGCEGIPAGSLSDYEAGIRSIGQVIIVNTNWAKQVGDDVVARALLGAIKGYILLKSGFEQPAKDIHALSPITQLPQAYDEVSLDEKHGLLPWTFTPMDPRHGFAWIDASHVAESIATLESAGVLEKGGNIPAAGYFTTRYLEDPRVRSAVLDWGKRKWSPVPANFLRQCGLD